MPTLEQLEVNEGSPKTFTKSFSRRKMGLIIGTVATVVVVGLVLGMVLGYAHLGDQGSLDMSSSSSDSNSNSNNYPSPNNEGSGDGHVFSFSNKCSQNVWVGILNNPGKLLPNSGGFLLTPGQSNFQVNLPVGWAGRMWGRTGCDSTGHCQTGDCGGKIQCNGAGGNPPVSLAEFTLDSSNDGTDWYDVSLVDGYNLPIEIALVAGSFKKANSSPYECGTAGCTSDLNSICPSDLQMKGPSGNVIACMSACEKYNTDQYCCRGNYNTPQTCHATTYSEVFKQACPGAYSYAYDDPTSTFTCHSNPGQHTNYQITFCT